MGYVAPAVAEDGTAVTSPRSRQESRLAGIVRTQAFYDPDRERVRAPRGSPQATVFEDHDPHDRARRQVMVDVLGVASAQGLDGERMFGGIQLVRLDQGRPSVAAQPREARPRLVPAVHEDGHAWFAGDVADPCELARIAPHALRLLVEGRVEDGGRRVDRVADRDEPRDAVRGDRPERALAARPPGGVARSGSKSSWEPISHLSWRHHASLAHRGDSGCIGDRRRRVRLAVGSPSPSVAARSWRPGSRIRSHRWTAISRPPPRTSAAHGPPGQRLPVVLHDQRGDGVDTVVLAGSDWEGVLPGRRRRVRQGHLADRLDDDRRPTTSCPGRTIITIDDMSSTLRIGDGHGQRHLRPDGAAIASLKILLDDGRRDRRDDRERLVLRLVAGRVTRDHAVRPRPDRPPDRLGDTLTLGAASEDADPVIRRSRVASGHVQATLAGRPRTAGHDRDRPRGRRARP